MTSQSLTSSAAPRLSEFCRLFYPLRSPQQDGGDALGYDAVGEHYFRPEQWAKAPLSLLDLATLDSGLQPDDQFANSIGCVG